MNKLYLFPALMLLLCSCNQKSSPQLSRPDSFINSIGLVMVGIPKPSKSLKKHNIKLYMSATEVTNAQYELFQPEHSEKRDQYSPGDNHPVVWVSWDDAISFTKWLKKKEGLPYTLPTERYWQWAAQGADRDFLYATGNGSISKDLVNYAGIGDTDQFLFTSPVGSFPPNPLGLYDMSGNVWEWCYDWHYKRRTLHRVWIKFKFFPRLKIPFVWYGLRKKWRVLRGGSYVYEEILQRTTVRNGSKPWEKTASYGFRVVLPARNLKLNTQK